MSFEQWQHLAFNRLTSEYDDYYAECEDKHNVAMDFDNWCVNRFDNLDNSDEAYERYRDDR